MTPSDTRRFAEIIITLHAKEVPVKIIELKNGRSSVQSGNAITNMELSFLTENIRVLAHPDIFSNFVIEVARTLGGRVITPPTDCYEYVADRIY